MLALGHGSADDLALALASPGGFAWWYLDLVDAQGDGAVLLWSFGLPFLPGARAGATARERPALSLALYRGGAPTFYALQEHDPADAAFDGQTTRLGRSALRLERRGGVVTLDGALELRLPGGERLSGTVRVEGPATTLPGFGPGPGALGLRARDPARGPADPVRGPADPARGPADPARGPVKAGAAPADEHRWAPITAATHGVLDLTIGGERTTLAGRAYLDSNHSARPLHALGIADWRWGRVALPDREVLYYLVEPEEGGAPEVRLALSVGPDGAAVVHPSPTTTWCGRRRGAFGLEWHETLHLQASGLDLEVRLAHLVDDGPFYLRWLVEGREASGAAGFGVAERVVPGAVDRPWQRPFVRMRRHHAGGGNSMWVPLFVGRRRGRLARLLRHWWSPGGAEEAG